MDLQLDTFSMGLLHVTYVCRKVFLLWLYSVQIIVNRSCLLSVLNIEFSSFSELMNSPALCLNKVERIGRIVDILKNETFCGFPVVNAKGRVSNVPQSFISILPLLWITTFNGIVSRKELYRYMIL